MADAGEGRLRELVTQRAFTRIGRSLGNGGVIPAEKIAETADVVRTQAAVASEVGAVQIVAVATAAIRTAGNRAELVDAVQEAGGMELSILSGEEEARLSFVGATRTLVDAPAGTVAVIDVGGGSSEIAIGEANGSMTWSESFRIGSGFLADSYLRSDPPSADELGKVRRHVEGTFEGLEPPPADGAVAVGGTATSLRRLVAPSWRTRRSSVASVCCPALRSPRSPSGSSSTRSACVCSRRDPDPRGDLRSARTAAPDRARRPARGAPARARGGTAPWLALSDGRELGRAKQHDELALLDTGSPPFFMRTCAPVRACTAIEKSGSCPTSSTLSPRPAASASPSNGPPGSFGSCFGSTPSGSQASFAVSPPHLRARQARVDLHSEPLQGMPRGARLPLTLLGEWPLRVRRSVGGIPMAQQPQHDASPYRLRHGSRNCTKRGPGTLLARAVREP